MSRVLLVSQGRVVAGAEVYLERLAAHLPGWTAEIAVPARSVFRPWTERLRAQGRAVTVYRDDPAGWIGLARNARRRGVELLHVNLPSTYDGASGLLAWTLARSGGLPVVTTEHLTRLPRSRRRRAVKLLTAGSVARVLVVSRAAQEALVAEGVPAGRVTVVPNGVPDPGEPDPVGLETPLAVGVLASLEERKQLHVLLDAAAPVPGVRIDIAGEGPLRARLEAQAGELGLAERVRFLGRVEDPYAFLAPRHVLALPSRLEGMPLSVLEAFAAGRGALVSDIPGLSEVVEEGRTGRLLPAGDVAAWSGALREAAADRPRVRAWGEAARARYRERFSVDRSARAVAAVYDEVLGEGGVRILWMKPVLPFPPNQGGRRITLQALRHLAGEHEVRLFARRIAPGDAAAADALCAEIPGLGVVAPLAPNRRSLLHRAWYRTRVRARAGEGIPPVEGYTALPELLDCFSQEIARFDPELVVVEYWYSMPYLERARGRARVLFVQDVDYDVRRTGDAAGRADGRETRWGALEEIREKRALREAPRVWFLTERDRDLAVRDLALDGARCDLLPYGLDLEGDLAPRRPEDPPEEAELVVFFGSFAADFNRDALRFTLEEVWPEVLRRRPTARLLVAGGDLPPDLAARAAARGAQVHGDVRRVREVLLRAAVVLVPLRFGGGLRIRLLESLALERATVGTAVGVLGMGPRAGREVVVGETAGELAQQVTDLLGNAPARAALGAAGRAWVSAHHDMERAAARQRELVGEAGRGAFDTAGHAD